MAHKTFTQKIKDAVTSDKVKVEMIKIDEKDQKTSDLVDKEIEPKKTWKNDSLEAIFTDLLEHVDLGAVQKQEFTERLKNL